MQETTVDYYFLEGLFVNDLPEKYSCPICLSSVQREAFLTQCCGSHFCYQCISRLVNSAKPCPLCKVSPLAVFPNKERQREINSLAVCCPTGLLKDEGSDAGNAADSSGGDHTADCDWTGELGQVEQHLRAMHVGDTRWKDYSSDASRSPPASTAQRVCVFHLNRGSRSVIVEGSGGRHHHHHISESRPSAPHRGRRAQPISNLTGESLMPSEHDATGARPAQLRVSIDNDLRNVPRSIATPVSMPTEGPGAMSSDAGELPRQSSDQHALWYEADAIGDSEGAPYDGPVWEPPPQHSVPCQFHGAPFHPMQQQQHSWSGGPRFRHLHVQQIGPRPQHGPHPQGPRPQYGPHPQHYRPHGPPLHHHRPHNYGHRPHPRDDDEAPPYYDHSHRGHAHHHHPHHGYHGHRHHH